jgi:hypothetical protein
MPRNARPRAQLTWRRVARALLGPVVAVAQRMGYTRLVRDLVRSRWDWLRELVARHRGDPATSPRSTAALHDAIARLGLADDAIVDGLAEALGLEVGQVSQPDEVALARAVPEDLALLLPPLCEHPSAQLRELARRWLALPTTIYAIPIDRAERWLADHRAIAEQLAPRVRGEGLAWLGPEALARLADTGATPEVRGAAAAWRERVQTESPG